jgi:hypothetical protein
MLNAEQQQRIIKANNEAFEELARRWRNPESGETEPDLGKALLKMVCDYMTRHCFSVPSDKVIDLIYLLHDWAGDPIDASVRWKEKCRAN